MSRMLHDRFLAGLVVALLRLARRLSLRRSTWAGFAHARLCAAILTFEAGE